MMIKATEDTTGEGCGDLLLDISLFTLPFYTPFLHSLFNVLSTLMYSLFSHRLVEPTISSSQRRECSVRVSESSATSNNHQTIIQLQKEKKKQKQQEKEKEKELQLPFDPNLFMMQVILEACNNSVQRSMNSGADLMVQTMTR
jgi:hypothetical protein